VAASSSPFKSPVVHNIRKRKNPPRGNGAIGVEQTNQLLMVPEKKVFL
jgi:hypothetical protein